MDIEKSYSALFELLWYSQMPCFDVKGVTSQKRNEFGEQHDIHQSHTASHVKRYHFRYAQDLLLERFPPSLLQYLYKVPYRPRNVLLIQHGKGRQTVSSKQVHRDDGETYGQR
jgi:hypothetical protein